ncbi:hypothetical protein BGZ93_007876 [Podila epicladia]|nr:hypothetical protein BGZ92_000609 [Podila epicladia]KAG0099380.1 hypothetical protein BGZ93_007876 [Podila epicladia]
MPTPMENIGIPLDANEASQPKTTATIPAPISFADLLFDSILMQQARTKGELHQHTHGLAQIDISYIADAFKIAIRTCYLDHTIANVSTASKFGRVLENSQMDHIDRVRSYIIQRKGSNGIFPKNMIILPQEKVMEHFLIPIAGAATMASFDDAYAKASKLDMEMIALIIYQIRTQSGETIKTRDLDRRMSQAIFSFGPRYFSQRANKRERDSQPALNPDESSSSNRYSQKEIQSVINKFASDMKELQMGNYSTTRPTYGLQGLLDLPTALATDKAICAVTTAADALFKAQVPSDRYKVLRSDLIKRLQKIIDKTFPGSQLRIEAFGSYASGLGSDTSDADLCITRDNFDRYARYNNLRVISVALRNGGMTKILPILNARVPIVKFMDPFSKINCDVNCNHVLGVHNSELIRCYTMIDPRVKPMVYNVKALVKAHGINDSSQGTLSSYAYVMMILGFLQAQEPPILPSLQAQPKERLTELFVQLDHEGRGGKDLIDCSFDHDIDRYRNFGAANTKSVGQLLIEFFEFYCRYFDYRTLEVNVRLGGYRIQKEVLKRRSSGRKQLLPGQGEKKLIVMDPFILDRNVAGSCNGRHLTHVWRTFQWLYYQLSLGHHPQAFASIPGSYFLFEMQLREYHQKQASSLQPDSSKTNSQAIDKGTVSATKRQEEPVAHKKPDQPKESIKHGSENASKTSQRDLSDDSEDSDDDGDEDGQKSGNSASKSKKRRARKATKYRQRLEAAISEAVQRGDDPSRFSALLAKAPPSILGSDKSNNNEHPSEAGPMREFIRAVAAAVRDSNLSLPPLGPSDKGDTTTTTTTTKRTTTTRQNNKRPQRTSQRDKKQQRHQSAQNAKSGTEQKGAGSSSRPLSLLGPKGRSGHEPQKDQKKQTHPDKRTRDQEVSLFPVLAKTRNVLPQPPANE